MKNVSCALEYQPLEEEGDGNDLLFLAWSSPYQEETFYMNLLESLIHSAAAPGRHLSKDAIVEGAICSSRPWKRGFRLPAMLPSKKWLLCKRRSLEPILFEVETKWGVCSQRITSGDTTPRDIPRIRSVRDLPPLGP